jgi:hypothetical protein
VFGSIIKQEGNNSLETLARECLPIWFSSCLLGAWNICMNTKDVVRLDLTQKLTEKYATNIDQTTCLKNEEGHHGDRQQTASLLIHSNLITLTTL